ncbi:MAG: tRNA dihydrouridine synthase DusB [Anaerolineaceae bacterium]|nr:tRNA dihydrouridine synthase DusB [Anaerolineaceae bacterium]
MDGYSDLPFRFLTREMGSSMSYTEFINAIDVVHDHPRVKERTSFDETERPVVFQLFDDDPERLMNAAFKLRKLNPDIIDINMGCSTKRVTGRGAGAGLLRAPKKIALIFKKLTQMLDIPITGKIRLGWDESTRNYIQVAKIIEENGGQLIAVHARTKEQGYTGQADWDAIAEIKQNVSIPVIGNGDVTKVQDIARMKMQTNCDGVMIGRGAIGNPWIFSRRDKESVSIEEQVSTIKIHLESMLEFYGNDRGLTLFRKHISRYFSSFELTSLQRKKLLTCNNPEDFSKMLDQFFLIKTEINSNYR